MIWKKLKDNWLNAIGELLIIVVGVLIALAIDQWNANRLERQEEVDAVSRILIDLQTDLDDFAFRLESVSAKDETASGVTVFIGNTFVPIFLNIKNFCAYSDKKPKGISRDQAEELIEKFKENYLKL